MEESNEISDSVNSVLKLDGETSSAIRHGQVITKVSDVVRELVDNSVDAGASSVQVLLNNFGIDKIEVKDTGHGISTSDFKNAVAGGYTSKLTNVQHPSCEKSYGFRGEALSSICSCSNVSITTKTMEEAHAIKYVLDKFGSILSESKVACVKGTVVTVEKIFYNLPVRRQWIRNIKKCTAELSEIEAYLRAIAVANPKIHIVFYHNGTTILTKPSVATIDQALITVLGHKLATNLVKCDSINIEVGDGKPEETRTLETFLLKKPIDMKWMSFTSNKLTMILVNRKRVYIREFEKLIQRYVAAVVEKPAPADQRRFPVAVLNIKVPSDEADFNRLIDKSKIFLVHKNEISKKLEEVLIKFYGIDLNISKESDVRELSENNGTGITLNPPTTLNTPRKNNPQSQVSSVVPIPDSQDSEKRNEAILAFLQNIPSVSSSNFTQSPVKEFPVNFNFPKSNYPAQEIETAVPIHNTSHHNMEIEALREPGISNFDLRLDEWSYTQTQQDTNKDTGGEKEEARINMKDWIHGRITDSHGEIIENVSLVTRPPNKGLIAGISPSEESSIHWTHKSFYESPAEQHSAFAKKIAADFRPTSSYEIQIEQPAAKRPKLSESGQAHRVNKSFSSGKQVTLDSYANWQTPGNRLSQAGSFSSPNTPTGVRFPLSGSMRPSTSAKTQNANSIGIPSVSIRGLSNNSITNSVGPYGLRNKANYVEESVTNCSPNSSQGISGSKLIGEINGTEYYAAQVNELVGVFSPLSMLSIFPLLKYELKISFDQLSPPTPENPVSEYVVSKDGVSKLFAEFLSAVDSSSEAFSKIFHVLIDGQELKYFKQSSAA